MTRAKTEPSFLCSKPNLVDQLDAPVDSVNSFVMSEADTPDQVAESSDRRGMKRSYRQSDIWQQKPFFLLPSAKNTPTVYLYQLLICSVNIDLIFHRKAGCRNCF